MAEKKTIDLEKIERDKDFIRRVILKAYSRGPLEGNKFVSGFYHNQKLPIDLRIAVSNAFTSGFLKGKWRKNPMIGGILSKAPYYFRPEELDSLQRQIALESPYQAIKDTPVSWFLPSLPENITKKDIGEKLPDVASEALSLYIGGKLPGMIAKKVKSIGAKTMLEKRLRSLLKKGTWEK